MIKDKERNVLTDARSVMSNRSKEFISGENEKKRRSEEVWRNKVATISKREVRRVLKIRSGVSPDIPVEIWTYLG